MLVQQTRYSLLQIIDRVRKGRLALPEFQRDFVWTPSQTCDLLNSISKEWPIGNLLLLRGPQPFAFRPIDTAPSIQYHELDMYVLDGQQRVTAIFHAAANVSPYVFFVDFEDLRENSGQEPVQFARRSVFERNYPTINDRAKSGKALCSDILDAEKFHKWLSCVEGNRARSDYLSLREKVLSGLNLKSYFLYAMELDQEIELDALAKIFETINKTGVRLNAFDLLVAKLYPSGFHLKEEWDLLKEENVILREMDVDGLELIKLISLISRKSLGSEHSSGVRQGDILKLQPDLISELWHDAARSYISALNEVKELGVISPSLVPSWSMILLAGAKDFFDLDFDFYAWWKYCILHQTFAQAANTRVISELDWIFSSNRSVRALPSVQDLDDILSLAARPNGTLLRGVVGLMLRMGARDPLTGDKLIDERDVVFLEVGESGGLITLTRETPIKNVFVCSERNASALRKLGAKIDLPHALESQGYGGGDPEVRAAYFRGLFA